jgi:hypothetical protein
MSDPMGSSPNRNRDIPNMTRELDDLMNLDPLELSEQDIDDIIAYQRKARGEYDDGKKSKSEPLKRRF